MSNLVIVNGHQMTVKEWNGQKVVTFKNIDELHGRPEGTAARNFRTNKNYFTDGEDYFYLAGEALDEFRRNLPGEEISKYVPDLYLITETGYLLLVKSLTDELSWTVQKLLIKTYFQYKESQSKPNAVVQLEALHQTIGIVIEQEKKLHLLETQTKVQGAKIEQLENKIEKRMTDDFELQLVVPTLIGKMFEPPLSANAVNKKLQQLGLQYRAGGEWVASVDGKKFSSSEPVQLDNGKMIYQLKWQRRVKDLIAEAM